MSYIEGIMQCVATFPFSIELPEHITTWEDAVEYAREHVNEIPVGELTYVCDSDVIDEEHCKLIE